MSWADFKSPLHTLFKHTPESVACKTNPDYNLLSDHSEARSSVGIVQVLGAEMAKWLELGFDSRTRRHMWVDFVFDFFLLQGFFSRFSGFPPSTKANTSTFFFVKREPEAFTWHCNVILFIYYRFHLFESYLKLHIANIVFCNCIPSELHLSHCSTVFTCLYEFEVLRWIP